MTGFIDTLHPLSEASAGYRIASLAQPRRAAAACNTVRFCSHSTGLDLAQRNSTGGTVGMSAYSDPGVE